MTEEQARKATRSALKGRHGSSARDATLMALMRLQEEQALDRLRVFGTNGVRVMHAGGGLLFSKK